MFFILLNVTMLLLLDKPSGITSHDAITAVKKHLRQPARDALSEDEKQ